VPIAITVSPMVASLTSSDRATSIDPSTRSSAPTSTSPIPASSSSPRNRSPRPVGHRRQIEAQRPPFERDRQDQRAEAEDEEDVDQVGADDVADGQTRAPLADGVDADGQLGQARPECDDGEADDDRSDAEVGSERGAAANEHVSPDEEPCQPGHDEQGTRHGVMLRAILLSSPRRWCCPVHTDIPTRADLEWLLSARDAACVSIYLPTSPEERGERDRIEFKNLSAEALEQLEASAVVNEVRDVLDDLVEDPEFWTRQAHSLAVFATPSGARTFQVANRLSPLVEVSDRFHLKPLLRSATFPQAAYVLALSQNAARLVEVSPDEPPVEVKVPGMPTDAASAVGKASIADRSADRRIQGSEGQKIRLRQYSRRVEEALRPLLSGLDLPLILAGTEPLA
jgi:hypothetical protein